MCGIVAVISKTKAGLFKAHADMFSQLFFVNQLRGTDGAGLIYNRGEACWFLKRAGAASSLLGIKAYNESISQATKEGNFIIGHNRAATIGKVSNQTSHPFTEKHITLVHNGTIRNHKELASADVDSHAICKYIAHHGIEKAAEKIDGAFALAWYDSKEKTINFIRNYDRPLHLLDCAGVWILASESKMAEWIADRNNYKVNSTKLLVPGTLYSFSLDNLSDYTETKLSLRKEPRTSVTSYSGWWEKSYSGTSNSTDNKGTPNKIYFYGDTIQFSPRGIFTDQNVNGEEYLLCDIEFSNLDTVRIYARDLSSPLSLEELKDADKIQGTVNATILRGERRTYKVKNIRVLSEEPEKLADDEVCSGCGSTIWKGTTDFEKYNSIYFCKACSDEFKRPVTFSGDHCGC